MICWRTPGAVNRLPRMFPRGRSAGQLADVFGRHSLLGLTRIPRGRCGGSLLRVLAPYGRGPGAGLDEKLRQRSVPVSFHFFDIN